MAGVQGIPKLPNEMICFIYKYLETNENRFSVALSGTIPGFDVVYRDKISSTQDIFINYKCHFLAPVKWNVYFTQYISPEFINKFSAEYCYWLHEQQLCVNIAEMRNLEDLAINGTKVSLQQSAKILVACPMITKLAFSYEHKERHGENEREITASPVIKDLFKKITSLSITTSVVDAKNFVNDPWVFIFKILSWCQDCTSLTVNIVYNGESDDDQNQYQHQTEVERYVDEEIIPQVGWMMSLQSLVLIKLGSCEDSDLETVSSSMLQQLLHWMFSDQQPHPNALSHFWVHKFDYTPPASESMQSLVAYREDPHHISDDLHLNFRDVKHYGGIRIGSLEHLQDLKSVYGEFGSSRDPQEMLDFIRNHPNLEHMSVFYSHDPDLPITVPFYVPNVAIKLFKLKSLCCKGFTIVKQMIEEFAIVYPNLASLYLLSYDNGVIQFDDECLSSIRFPNLTSLSLDGFNVEGSFLLPVIAQCPKLERLLIGSDISSNSTFIGTLSEFLKKAVNLQDLRLQLDVGKDFTNVFRVFKSLKTSTSHLERITLAFECESLPADLDETLPALLVKFLLKMKRLTAACIIFFDLDDDVIEKVHQRIVVEVLPTRPTLWFHLGCEYPYSTDPDVPFVHFIQMVDSDGFNPVPSF